MTIYASFLVHLLSAGLSLKNRHIGNLVDPFQIPDKNWTLILRIQEMFEYGIVELGFLPSSHYIRIVVIVV